MKNTNIMINLLNRQNPESYISFPSFYPQKYLYIFLKNAHFFFKIMAVCSKILYIQLVGWGYEKNVPSDQKCEAFKPVENKDMGMNKHNSTQFLLSDIPHFTCILIIFALNDISAVNNI